MSIEKNLERIADALEAIASGTATTPSPSSKKSSEKSSKSSRGKSESSKTSSEDTPSKNDVRAALKALQKATDAKTAREMLQKFDAKTVTDLDEDNYAGLIEACEEACA